MKILSYNLYGVKDTNFPILNWEERQKNLELILNDLLLDEELVICCFQEVNENNMELLERILKNNNFVITKKFSMITESILQYNIVAYKTVNFEDIYCLPHGKDETYLLPDKQIIDYEMSDYRTTVFISFNYNNKKYIIGNIHTDYISIEGKRNGTIKSLNYLDKQNADYKFIVGDMNMVSHMAEVYQILKIKNNYTTLSRSNNFNILDQSWHGFGTMEQVTVDFAFIPKEHKNKYSYNIIKQDDIFDEGSDHRPIIIEIFDDGV
jgi:hypothetical protein